MYSRIACSDPRPSFSVELDCSTDSSKRQDERSRARFRAIYRLRYLKVVSADSNHVSLLTEAPW